MHLFFGIKREFRLKRAQGYYLNNPSECVGRVDGMVALADFSIDSGVSPQTYPRHIGQVLSVEELAQKAMDNAANAMAAGWKTLSREEALGQEASSALLHGGTISDKVHVR